MKIGVFDSGLGGLFTMQAIVAALPLYEYVYLGDTKRLPYGTRSAETIYEFLKDGIDFLAAKDCALIIVACNTASAEALRIMQQVYLPQKYPELKVLGMIVPMTEAVASYARVGLLATQATIISGAYPREAKKRAPKTTLIPLAAPLLVPLIESGDMQVIPVVIKNYLEYFKDKKIDALLLGCTHYGILKDQFKKILPKNVSIVSQDTVVPEKTKDYLLRHPEIEKKLGKHRSRAFYVTDSTIEIKKMAILWFGKNIKIQKVQIETIRE